MGKLAWVGVLSLSCKVFKMRANKQLQRIKISCANFAR